MKQSTFKILFYLRSNHVNKDGTSAIIVRVSIDGERQDWSTKLVCEPERWDGKAGKATGRSSKSFEINNHLQDIQTILTNHFYDIQRRHGYVTVEMVRNAYMGITQREESLLKLYEQHLEDTKKLVGLSKADPTYRKYERMYRRVVEFMKKKYNITDIPLREIKYQFIVDLEFFLRTEYKYSQNTTYKCMKFFKQVINKAIRAGLITVDPFNGYKISIERVDQYALEGFIVTSYLQRRTKGETVDIVSQCPLQTYHGSLAIAVNPITADFKIGGISLHTLAHFHYHQEHSHYLIVLNGGDNVEIGLVTDNTLFGVLDFNPSATFGA